jgi:hypothetical protein
MHFPFFMRCRLLLRFIFIATVIAGQQKNCDIGKLQIKCGTDKMKAGHY